MQSEFPFSRRNFHPKPGVYTLACPLLLPGICMIEFLFSADNIPFLAALGLTLGLLVRPDAAQGSFGYNFTVFIVLFLTLLFANFAEAIAEARGKAQADSLRKTRQ